MIARAHLCETCAPADTRKLEWTETARDYEISDLLVIPSWGHNGHFEVSIISFDAETMEGGFGDNISRKI